MAGLDHTTWLLRGYAGHVHKDCGSRLGMTSD
jgi:hypothetical protein